MVFSLGMASNGKCTKPTTIFFLTRYSQMRYLLLFFFLGVKFCAAQTFSYPKCIKQGKTLQALIPQNWKVIDTAYGDLNNDQAEDLAFVLEYHLPVAENRAYGDNETELISLGYLFQKQGYRKLYLRTAE